MPAADYRRPTAHDAALGDVDVTRTLFAILFCFWFHAHCDRFNWLTVKFEAHVNLLRRIRIRTEKRINLVDLGGRRRDDESRRTGGQTDGQTGRQARHVNGDRSPVVGRSLARWARGKRARSSRITANVSRVFASVGPSVRRRSVTSRRRPTRWGIARPPGHACSSETRHLPPHAHLPRN